MQLTCLCESFIGAIVFIVNLLDYSSQFNSIKMSQTPCIPEFYNCIFLPAQAGFNYYVETLTIPFHQSSIVVYNFYLSNK